jgi:UPF0271 protein
MHQIDLNCDMGESYGAWHMGNDEAVLEHVTSANVACGFHGGDPRTMRATVTMALARGVAIGAHPGFPDLQGFGRRPMTLSKSEAYETVLYQIGALAGFAQAAGTRLVHVKAHGMLYNMAVRDSGLAEAIAQAVHDFDRNLVFFGLAGSELIRAGEKLGLQTASEVFADRSYQDDGSLTPRSQPGAMIEDVEVSVTQVKRMVLEGVVRSVSGKDVPVRADTLCVHGDQPGAVAFARRIRSELAAEGVKVAAIGASAL